MLKAATKFPQKCPYWLPLNLIMTFLVPFPLFLLTWILDFSKAAFCVALTVQSYSWLGELSRYPCEEFHPHQASSLSISLILLPFPNWHCALPWWSYLGLCFDRLHLCTPIPDCIPSSHLCLEFLVLITRYSRWLHCQSLEGCGISTLNLSFEISFPVSRTTWCPSATYQTKPPEYYLLQTTHLQVLLSTATLILYLMLRLSWNWSLDHESLPSSPHSFIQVGCRSAYTFHYQ